MATYKITWMCKILEVARSSYYAWHSRADKITSSAARRAVLSKKKISELFDEGKGRWGHRRIRARLNQAGMPASLGLARQIDARVGFNARSEEGV